METIIFALILVLIAGFINGSFATPMKYMAKWNEENTWFAFSFWGFLILPWLTILFMVPHTFKVVSALPSNLLSATLIGGLVFGLGQIAFALSFRYIGIGLAFVVNMSMGTAGSALIPLIWHKNLLGTEYSHMQFAGIVIFVFAVSFGAAAGSARDRNRQGIKVDQSSKVKEIKTGKHLLGVMLAILAGVGSICQGVSYIWANPEISKIATSQFGIGELASSVIAWVIIFSAAWIPYCCYFFVLNCRNKSFSNFKVSGTCKYWIITILMGVGFWGSLVFFSQASNVIGGDLAPTIAWPLFMVFIILTSNFWSWKSDEWKNAGTKASRRMIFSLALFVVAIIVFSISSTFEPGHDIECHHIKHRNYPTCEHKSE